MSYPIYWDGSSEKGFVVVLDKVTVKSKTRKERIILEDVSFSMRAGEFLAIVGENGTGKTTLLETIAGEAQERDTLECTGSIRIGNDIVDRPATWLLAVGVVHQSSQRDLIDHLTVAQNIALRQYFARAQTRRLLLVNDDWAQPVRDVLSRSGASMHFGLSQLVSELSGGERQALSVITAMLLEHKDNPCGLVLLDEHTSKLDHENAGRVMEFTANLVRSIHCTAVMVTHRFADAKKYADTICYLKGAKATLVKNDEQLTVDKMKEYVFSK